MTETDLAYLAGLIDGEGTIGLARRGRSGSRRHYESWSLLVAITNTDPRMIQWLQHNAGGDLIAIRRVDNPKHRNALRWEVRCDRAQKLLEQCYRYLVTKKDQARLALDFQRTLRGPSGASPTPYTIKEYRRQIREKMHELRMRGYTIEELETVRKGAAWELGESDWPKLEEESVALPLLESLGA